MAQRAGAAVDVDFLVREASSLIAIMVTTAKASLISYRSTSAGVPAGLVESFLIAPTGAVVNRRGLRRCCGRP